MKTFHKIISDQRLKIFKFKNEVESRQWVKKCKFTSSFTASKAVAKLHNYLHSLIKKFHVTNALFWELLSIKKTYMVMFRNCMDYILYKR